MMTTDLIAAPTDAVFVGVPMMDEAEARATVTRIKTRIDIARGELLELHDREGWRALGYKSWETCARQEFGGSAAQMYRLLSAAQIERAIDSPIGEYPESHLREVARLDTPDQQKQALEAARAHAKSKPTAKDVRQAATEISAPDLPIDFAVVQRRLHAHGVALSHKHGMFVLTDRSGATSTTREWEHVRDRLALLEDGMEEESTPAPDLSDRQAHLAKEARDAGRIERARSLIEHHEHDAARVVLSQIEVSTYARDQLLATIPIGRQITLALTDADCAALLKEAHAFEASGLTKKLPAIGQALVLIVEGIRGAV